MTPVKQKHFDKSFHHHDQQLLHEAGTKPTGFRSAFTKKLAQMTSAAEEEVYGGANMSANKPVENKVRLSDAESAPTTWSFADRDRVMNQLEREN